MPAKVIETPDPGTRIGRVESGGARWEVNLGLLDGVTVGEWVVVQMGIAVRTVDEVTAREMLELLKALRFPAGSDRVGDALQRER